jgi:hypothetical protein
MTRAAFTATELVAALSAAVAVCSLAAFGVQERLALGRAEQRAADLEVAQNLLDARRAGQSPALPAGWSWEERPLAAGVRLVAVVGPRQVRLATLCAEDR